MSKDAVRFAELEARFDTMRGRYTQQLGYAN